MKWLSLNFGDALCNVAAFTLFRIRLEVLMARKQGHHFGEVVLRSFKAVLANTNDMGLWNNLEMLGFSPAFLKEVFTKNRDQHVIRLADYLDLAPWGLPQIEIFRLAPGITTQGGGKNVADLERAYEGSLPVIEEYLTSADAFFIGGGHGGSTGKTWWAPTVEAATGLNKPLFAPTVLQSYLHEGSQRTYDEGLEEIRKVKALGVKPIVFYNEGAFAVATVVRKSFYDLNSYFSNSLTAVVNTVTDRKQLDGADLGNLVLNKGAGEIAFFSIPLPDGVEAEAQIRSTKEALRFPGYKLDSHLIQSGVVCTLGDDVLNSQSGAVVQGMVSFVDAHNGAVLDEAATKMEKKKKQVVKDLKVPEFECHSSNLSAPSPARAAVILSAIPLGSVQEAQKFVLPEPWEDTEWSSEVKQQLTIPAFVDSISNRMEELLATVQIPGHSIEPAMLTSPIPVGVPARGELAAGSTQNRLRLTANVGEGATSSKSATGSKKGRGKKKRVAKSRSAGAKVEDASLSKKTEDSLPDDSSGSEIQSAPPDSTQSESAGNLESAEPSVEVDSPVSDVTTHFESQPMAAFETMGNEIQGDSFVALAQQTAVPSESTLSNNGKGLKEGSSTLSPDFVAPSIGRVAEASYPAMYDALSRHSVVGSSIPPAGPNGHGLSAVAVVEEALAGEESSSAQSLPTSSPDESSQPGETVSTVNSGEPEVRTLGANSVGEEQPADSISGGSSPPGGDEGLTQPEPKGAEVVASVPAAVRVVSQRRLPFVELEEVFRAARDIRDSQATDARYLLGYSPETHFDIREYVGKFRQNTTIESLQKAMESVMAFGDAKLFFDHGLKTVHSFMSPDTCQWLASLAAEAGELTFIENIQLSEDSGLSWNSGLPLLNQFRKEVEQGKHQGLHPDYAVDIQRRREYMILLGEEVVVRNSRHFAYEPARVWQFLRKRRNKKALAKAAAKSQPTDQA